MRRWYIKLLNQRDHKGLKSKIKAYRISFSMNKKTRYLQSIAQHRAIRPSAKAISFDHNILRIETHFYEDISYLRSIVALKFNLAFLRSTTASELIL